jgi:hypothetical protein
VHHGGHPANPLTLGEFAPTAPSHQHEDFEKIHHEHHFHVGIFHFLGHLLENIQHTNNFAEEFFVTSSKKASKKVVSHNDKIAFHFNYIKWQIVEREIKSLRAPPYILFLKQALTLATSPLRGPPAFV